MNICSLGRERRGHSRREEQHVQRSRGMKELDSFGSLKEGNVVSEVSEGPARRRAGEAGRSYRPC